MIIDNSMYHRTLKANNRAHYLCKVSGYEPMIGYRYDR